MPSLKEWEILNLNKHRVLGSQKHDKRVYKYYNVICSTVMRDEKGYLQSKKNTNIYNKISFKKDRRDRKKK